MWKKFGRQKNGNPINRDLSHAIARFGTQVCKRASNALNWLKGLDLYTVCSKCLNTLEE